MKDMKTESIVSFFLVTQREGIVSYVENDRAMVQFKTYLGLASKMFNISELKIVT